MGFVPAGCSQWLTELPKWPVHVSCHSVHSSRCPAMLAAQSLPAWWKQAWQESVKRTNQIRGRAQLWGCEHHCCGHPWEGAGQLSVLDPSGCPVHGAEMLGTGLRQQLNAKTAMCDCETKPLTHQTLSKWNHLKLNPITFFVLFWGDLLFFYLMLNFGPIKTSRLVLVEY